MRGRWGVENDLIVVEVSVDSRGGGGRVMSKLFTLERSSVSKVRATTMLGFDKKNQSLFSVWEGGTGLRLLASNLATTSSR